VRFTSRDRSMLLSITAPRIGFSLNLGGHVWLFDADAIIVGCLPPPEGHLAIHSPEHCPGCAEFIVPGRS
jgi:hypothetical protein